MSEPRGQHRRHQLSWRRGDIENWFGVFQPGSYTSTNKALTFIVASFVTGGFFLLISYLQKYSSLEPYLEVFLRGANKYTTIPCTLLFFWGIVMLFFKGRKINFQAKALDLPCVPQEPDFFLNEQTAKPILESLFEIVDHPRHFILFKRIEVGLASLQNIGEVRDVAAIVKNQADNDEAKAGMDRAINLDRVLEVMAEASALAIAEDWNRAQKAYQTVLDLDPEWSPARDGLQRIGATLVSIGYESAMSAGYAALAAKNYVEARRQFEEAKRLRSGDRDANSALAQIAEEQQLARIILLRTEAEKFDQAEQWSAAAKKYQEILQIDGSLMPLRQALQRARQREELKNRMNYEINAADQFNEQPIWQRANQVLIFAQSIEQPGPILADQILQLTELLEIAATPVSVQFESDNLTNVVVYKVGNLGTFIQRTLELRPGTYVAVGSRDGYRDVRRDFRVAPGGLTSPVVLRCEDPI